jgi:hypothetical protein
LPLKLSYMPHALPISSSLISRIIFVEEYKSCNFLWCVSFILIWSMLIESRNIARAILWHCIWPAALRSYFRNVWYDAFVYRNSCLQLMVLISVSTEEASMICSFSATLVPSELLHSH